VGVGFKLRSTEKMNVFILHYAMDRSMRDIHIVIFNWAFSRLIKLNWSETEFVIQLGKIDFTYADQRHIWGKFHKFE